MRYMLSMLRSAAQPLAVLVFFVASSAVAEDLCAISRDVIGKAQAIRGLEKKEPVPCLVQNRGEVERYILETVREQMPGKMLSSEGAVLSTLGFLPLDFDYEKELIELYVSQVGGYYDPKEGRYIMAGWLPGYLQRSVAVHELTHALQDQHFNLQSFLYETDLQSVRRNTDASLARSALVEGDAMAVMIDFARQELGAPGIASEANINAILFQNLLGAGLVTSSSGAPQTIMKLLMFPYTSGLRFVHHFLRQDGYARVDEIFARPPRSTEEILHPQKYLKEEPDFREISLEEIHRDYPHLQGWELLYQNVFGEFAIGVLIDALCESKCNASQLGRGWGGDGVFLFAHPERPDRLQLIWRLAWDSEGDAEEYFQSYKRYYGKQRRAITEHSFGAELSAANEEESLNVFHIRRTKKEGDIVFLLPRNSID